MFRACGMGLLCLAAIVFSGCGGQTPAPAKSGPQTPAAVPAEAKVTVKVIDAEGLQAAVEKHAGKIVLVDCWATWCVPCVKSFPATLELGRKHAADGLVVMSLSFDDPDEASLKKVQAMLEKNDATIENYVSSLDLSGEGQKAFLIEGGQIPHYKIYDRQGKLLKGLSAPDPEQPLPHELVEAEVLEALKQ